MRQKCPSLLLIFTRPTSQTQQSSTILILTVFFSFLDVWLVTAALLRPMRPCLQRKLWYGVFNPCDPLMLNRSRCCRPPGLGDDIGNSHILVLSSGGSHHLALLSPPGLCQHSSIWPTALCTAYQGKFRVLKKTMEPLISVRTLPPHRR